MDRIFNASRAALVLLSVALCSAAVFSAAPLAAQHSGFEPCNPDSAEFAAARALARTFEHRMDTAPANDASVLDDYRSLLNHRCLRVLREVPQPTHGSLLSFHDWWRRGGSDWIDSAFRVARTLTVPPDPNSVLTASSLGASSPLRHLLCAPDAGPACGAETRGWALRANAAFDRHTIRERERAEQVTPDYAAVCNRVDPNTPDALRYTYWSQCTAQLPYARTPTLPLAQVQAPQQGWLVLLGSRGNATCDEVQAYDLATGAAYKGRRCRELTSQDGGARAAHGEAEAGRVPRAAIRELAWLLMFGTHARELRRDAQDYAVPAGLRRRAVPNGRGIGTIGGTWTNSSQRQLSWLWVVGADVRAQGSTTWPDSNRAVDEHAATLIRVAEAAFDARCSPARFPRRLSGHIHAVEPADRPLVRAALVENLRVLPRRRCR